MNNKNDSTEVGVGPVFGFSVVLSLSEMATLTRAMQEKTQNARWFASNNLFGSRDKALADCDCAEKRIAELKAMLAARQIRNRADGNVCDDP